MPHLQKLLSLAKTQVSSNILIMIQVKFIYVIYLFIHFFVYIWQRDTQKTHPSTGQWPRLAHTWTAICKHLFKVQWYIYIAQQITQHFHTWLQATATHPLCMQGSLYHFMSEKAEHATWFSQENHQMIILAVENIMHWFRRAARIDTKCAEWSRYKFSIWGKKI